MRRNVQNLKRLSAFVTDPVRCFSKHHNHPDNYSKMNSPKHSGKWKFNFDNSCQESQAG